MRTADPDRSIGLPTEFRPSRGWRLFLITQWPIAVAFIPLAAVAFGLIRLGTPIAWAGWLLSGILLWGIWRTWNVSIKVSNDHLLIENPIRTYRLPLDGTLRFEMSLITTVFPSAIAVAVRANGRKIPIYASGFLRGTDQRRLSAIIRTFQRDVTGPALPETWGTAR